MGARYNNVIAALGAAVLAVCASVTLAAAPAAGQAPPCNDPYGCPTPRGEPPGTPPPGTPPPSCTVTSPESAGAPVRVVVHDVPSGNTVDLYLDGRVVATATAGPDQPDDSPGVVDVEMSFDSAELPSGSYELVAVGPTFQAECPSDVAVLGVTVTQTGAQAHPAARSGTSLARTGVGIALLLALALVLLIAGRLLLERSRRRRRVLEADHDHMSRARVRVR